MQSQQKLGLFHGAEVLPTHPPLPRGRWGGGVEDEGVDQTGDVFFGHLGQGRGRGRGGGGGRVLGRLELGAEIPVVGRGERKMDSRLYGGKIGAKWHSAEELGQNWTRGKAEGKLEQNGLEANGLQLG